MHLTQNLELFKIFVKRSCVDRAMCAADKGDDLYFPLPWTEHLFP